MRKRPSELKPELFQAIGTLKSDVGALAFYIPPHREPRTSRITERSVSVQVRVDELCQILSDCSRCGAKQSEVQVWYNGALGEPRDHEERLERRKKRGLPLMIFKTAKAD